MSCLLQTYSIGVLSKNGPLSVIISLESYGVINYGSGCMEEGCRKPVLGDWYWKLMTVCTATLPVKTFVRVSSSNAMSLDSSLGGGNFDN